MTEQYGVFVQVRAGINDVTGIISWEFQALDPLTGNVCNEES